MYASAITPHKDSGVQRRTVYSAQKNPLWEDIFILFHLWSVPTCIKVMAEFFLISNSIQGFYDVEGLDFKWLTIDTDFELGWGLENWARLQVKNGILVSASCNM